MEGNKRIYAFNEHQVLVKIFKDKKECARYFETYTEHISNNLKKGYRIRYQHKWYTLKQYKYENIYISGDKE